MQFDKTDDRVSRGVGILHVLQASERARRNGGGYSTRQVGCATCCCSGYHPLLRHLLPKYAVSVVLSYAHRMSYSCQPVGPTSTGAFPVMSNTVGSVGRKSTETLPVKTMAAASWSSPMTITASAARVDAGLRPHDTELSGS